MWDSVIEIDKDLAKRNHEAIFETILNSGLDSNQYADRVAASVAIVECCKSLSEDTLSDSNEFNNLLKKLLAITTSKANFNDKNQVLDNFTEVLVEMMPQTGTKAAQIRTEFLKACLP